MKEETFAESAVGSQWILISFLGGRGRVGRGRGEGRAGRPPGNNLMGKMMELLLRIE